jgi:arylsulfatase A-like enzyme
LWIHVPSGAAITPPSQRFTSHLDLVPTLLQWLGYDSDVLRTQGESLIAPWKNRRALLVSEQGFFMPAYHALVTPDYITRWRHNPRKFLFSGVERRDGAPVPNDERWLEEAKTLYPQAALDYDILPDVQEPLHRFAR